MEKYRKLTEDELIELLADNGINVKTKDKNQWYYERYVRAFYPSEVASLVIQYRSDYGDNGYNHEVVYVGAYDLAGNEILPLKGQERKARSKWKDNFPTPTSSDEYNSSKSEWPDLVIRLTNKLPELFVRE